MTAKQPSVRVKVELRPVGESGPQSRIILGGEGTAGPVDITGGLVGAIAHALWQARGGDSVTNWADAEGVLDHLLGTGLMAARSEVKPSTPARSAPVVPAATPAAAVTGGRKSSRR